MPKYFNYCHREWMLLNINHLIPILILTIKTKVQKQILGHYEVTSFLY